LQKKEKHVEKYCSNCGTHLNIFICSNAPEYTIYLLLGANSGEYLLIPNVRHKYFQVEMGYIRNFLKNMKRNLNIFSGYGGYIQRPREYIHEKGEYI